MKMQPGSRRHALVLGCGAAAFATRSLRADILRPGSKFVSHKMKFENLKSYEKEYKFFFLPLNQEKGPEWLKAQDEFGKTGVISVSGLNPLQVARSGGLHLVAVPRTMLDTDGGVPVDKLIEPAGGILRSEKLVGQIRAVQNADKDEFWTVYHVKIVDGKLQTGLIRHDEPMRRDPVKTNSLGSGGVAMISAFVAAGALWSRLRGRQEG